MAATRKEEKNRLIPTELHEEILFRLPANDLLNFKLVCKDWRRLISSPDFIQKHLKRSNVGCILTRFLMLLPFEIIDYNVASGRSLITNEIPYPPEFSSENTAILGACDGLVCLLDKGIRNSNFAVFNPSTGRCDIRILNEIEINFNSVRSYWFGHHPSTGEYVLVLGSLLLWPIRVSIQVYKFCSKLERVLSCSLVDRRVIGVEEIETLFHGNLHWPAIEIFGDGNDDEDGAFRYLVLGYDFEKNGVLEFPGPGESYFSLGVVDGRLSAIYKPGEMFELWIMEDYGVPESWMKYRNIEGYDDFRVLSPLGYSWRRQLIVDANRLKLTLFSFSGKEAAILKDQKFRVSSEAIMCADSLLSPALIRTE